MRKFKAPRFGERLEVEANIVTTLPCSRGLVYNTYEAEYNKRMIMFINAKWHVLYDVHEARDIMEAIRIQGHLVLVPIDPESNIKYLKKVV